MVKSLQMQHLHCSIPSLCRWSIHYVIFITKMTIMFSFDKLPHAVTVLISFIAQNFKYSNITTVQKSGKNVLILLLGGTHLLNSQAGL